MPKRLMYRINLDTSLCVNLRNKVNEYQHYSITKTHSIKKDQNGHGWNKICAIMDRLDDTLLYLNSLELNNTGSKLDVFDFYNFMNNAATLIDCVNFLAEIYEFDLSQINNSHDIFNKLGTTGKGNDKDYFEYLRSLCSVHPIETSRHKEFQDPATDTECSPFIYYNNGILAEEDYDLIVVVYTDGDKFHEKHFGIKIETIFKYIEYRYSLLQKITVHIEAYYQSIIEEYIKQPLRKVNEFSNYCDYIDYLQKVWADRKDTNWTSNFDFYRYVMQVSFSNSDNQQKLIKYQNAVKYAFTFLQKYLQELPKEDKYETTGLKTQPEHTSEDSLFIELEESLHGEYRFKHMYPFEKLACLWLQPRYMDMAKELLAEIKPFWERYVVFTEKMNPIEISILLQIATYFWRLDNDKWFTANIPETNEYR